MNHDHGDRSGADVTVFDPGTWWLIVALIAAVSMYVFATNKLETRQITWPMRRTLAWTLGVLSVGVALVGPLAERAHHDFAAHMAGHVLLGMLGPLLLVLAAPFTLALRVLPVTIARRLARLLASAPAAVLTNPFIAGTLNVGGLWVLYRSSLYAHDAHQFTCVRCCSRARPGSWVPVHIRSVGRPRPRTSSLVDAMACHSTHSRNRSPQRPRQNLVCLPAAGSAGRSSSSRRRNDVLRRSADRNRFDHLGLPPLALATRTHASAKKTEGHIGTRMTSRYSSPQSVSPDRRTA